VKHLPCIPDEVLAADDRRFCYGIELVQISHRSRGKLDPNLIFGTDTHGQETQESPIFSRLLAVIERLSETYLEVARERDQLRGVCDLAADDDFWEALAKLRKERIEHGARHGPTQETISTVTAHPACGGE
jgi:hypothetical protein